MREYSRQQLEKADNEARKDQLRAIQMQVAWNFGFKKITGDELYLLTKVPGTFAMTSIASNGPGGKWIVTKTVDIKESPYAGACPSR